MRQWMRIAQKLEAYVETWEGRDVQNPRSPNYKENKLKKNWLLKNFHKELRGLNWNVWSLNHSNGLHEGR